MTHLSIMLGRVGLAREGSSFRFSAPIGVIEMVEEFMLAYGNRNPLIGNDL